MSDSESFRSVIELWETREGMASDIGARAPAISKWWQRDNIPADWWSAILATDIASAAGITAEELTSLAARHSAKEEARQ